MKLASLSLFAVASLGIIACGGAPPAPAKAAPAPEAAPATGATMAQPQEDPARPLNVGECETLGEWIAEACHGGGSRSAQVEGWCSDVVARVSAGSWRDDCPKHVHYMDLVCFLGSSTARSMMSCNNSIDG